MKIEDSDHEIYNGWQWASQSSFYSEVVQFLKAEEVQVSGSHRQVLSWVGRFSISLERV